MMVNHILHGGDYNPEQWLDCPDILEEDLRLMKILATPSGAMPHWLTTSYPEVMQVQENGHRNLPGRRHNFCYTSPVMRKKIRQMDLELSKRFGNHKGVILWHISNEMGGNFGDGTCHCELCQQAFREWLKRKYQTLDHLNRAWWSEFWSHVYTGWDQIHSPVPAGECLSDGLRLDWRRFVSDQMTDRHEPVTLKNVGKWKDAETGEIYNGELNLKELSCMIVTAVRQ